MDMTISSQYTSSFLCNNELVKKTTVDYKSVFMLEYSKKDVHEMYKYVVSETSLKDPKIFR